MSYSGKGDAPSAMACIRKMEAWSRLRPFETAFKASLLLRNGEYEAAEATLQDVITSTADLPSDNAQYVNLFAKYLLSDLDGDDEACRTIRSQALRLDTRPALKRWLPL